MLDDNDSLNFPADNSLHIQTPNAPKQPIFPSNPNPHLNPNSNNPNNPTKPHKYIPILTQNKTTNKLTYNPQYQQYLMSDKSSAGAVVVGVMGSRQIGKSFLLDNLLGVELGGTGRVMGRNRGEVVNGVGVGCWNQRGDRIVYMDNNDNPTPSIFLQLYYISSLLIYNLSPQSEPEQRTLLDCIFANYENIKSNFNTFSRPQLVIVRRDAGKKEIYDFDFMRKLEECEIFQPEISVVYLPYPGNRGIMAKQLMDVPKGELDPNFLAEATKLHHLIHQAKPKQLLNHTLTPQTLNLTLESLTKSLNSQQPISIQKMKDYINEALGVGYYNNYLKNYSEELEKQLANEEPCDKYTMYRKLNKIRRRVNRKMERYNNMGDQPVFLKYKEKLEDTIRSKEAMVKTVNQAKCREVHQKNCNELVQNLNQKNYEELIDRYCKSSLDDQKIEVLLENYDKVIKNREPPKPVSSPVKVSKTRAGPPPELGNLNKQLEQLNKIIASKSKLSPPPKAPNLDVFKSSIETKKSQLMALKQEQEKVEAANSPQFILSEDPKNEQLIELDNQRQKLTTNIENYERQIANLRNKKESKLKQISTRLKYELSQEEQALKNLSIQTARASQPAQIQVKRYQAGQSVKKTCCSIM